MREGWKYKTFGDVGTFLRGKSIQKADFVEHGMPCIHYGQIHKKFGVSVEKHLSEIPEDLYNKSIIASPGDIVIAITSEDLEGSCKSTAWLGDYDVAVSSHAAVYKHNLNSKFIAYYLRSNSFYVEKEKYARGFKVMEIKPKDIARIQIPVPSEEIQSRVVAELDKINELIRLKKEQLNDYNNLAQSLFYEMFGDPVTNEKGWEIKKLEDVCNKINDGTHNSPKNEPVGEYMYVTAKNIKESGIILDNITYVNAETHYAIYDRCNPEYGDVLYIKDGVTTGIATINNLREPFSLLSSVALLKPSKNILNYYLKAVLNIPTMYTLIRSNMGGAAITRLTLVKINNIKIPVPPLALQQLFAQRIELIEQQKAEINSTIADLETLLASRMQYWFD